MDSLSTVGENSNIQHFKPERQDMIQVKLLDPHYRGAQSWVQQQMPSS